MVKRFDSYPHAVRDRFDVVLQCRLGIRVAKVGLHVLDLPRAIGTPPTCLCCSPRKALWMESYAYLSGEAVFALKSQSGSLNQKYPFDVTHPIKCIQP